MKLFVRTPLLMATLGMLLLSFSGNSQITLNTTMTPAQYVQNVLLGPGNVVSNITFNGSAAAANTVQNNVASFTSPAPFPMSAGLLMATNIASDAIGPNNSASQGGTPGPSVNNDPDLGLIAGGAVTSGAIIEFDFVAGSGFSFSYIFGSDEYPEWAPPNASVNDVFGFFLSGPGIAGGQGFVNNAINIARLPNNTQVSIDNVNPVTNTAFYVNNGGGAGWGTTIEYDGTTTLLTASPTLVCGTTYHMKLAVANTSDDAWGSAVFIQSGSFVTGSSISAGPNQAICTTASGIVQLAGVLSSITGQVWSTSGTGTFSSPNSPTATYTPSAADIAAGSVTITYTGNGLCSVVPLTSTMTLTFLNPTVTVTPASTTHCVPGTAVNLTGTATSSSATVPRTFTSTAPSTIPQNSTGTNNIIPVSGITPATLGANPIVNVTVNITHPLSRELEIRLISPSNQSIVLAPSNASFFGTAAGANYTNTVFTANPAHALITTGAPPYSGNWRPQTPLSTLTGNINGNWRLVVIDNYSGFFDNSTNGILNSWSITFMTENQIVSTVWTPATNLSSTTTLNTVATPATSTTYTLTATDATGCSASAQATITINPSVTPTFNAIVPICSGATAPVLPTTSTNGITGTWSPAVSNTTSGTYTFTPNAGQCATTTTLNITVNPSTTPTFAAIPAICSGTTTPVLPTTSTNGITGTWSPAVSNTASGTYTFTPNTGQCATTTTLSITVNPSTTPTFAAIPAICSGATAPVLPTTSTNGITGTWSPAVSNTASGTYTFTPNAGQCAATTTLSITVNPSVTPTFAAIPAICSGATAPVLPTTSTNGITGTWSPAVSNTASGTYTFTPNAGQCAATTTLSITVNPSVTPTFAAIPAICSGATAPVLSTTSTNGITGTWSPAAVSNTASGTYTFTPTAGQCAATTTLSVTVNPSVTPTFAAIPAICSGAAAPVLPTTSTNGITGTWSPAAVSNTASGTYTFTPTAGQCASSTTLSVTVNALPVVTVNSPTTCANTNVILDADGAVNYTWTPPAGLSATTGEQVTANIPSSSSYTVTGTDANGCQASAVSNVTIAAGLTLSVTPAAPSICAGTSVTLTASGATNYTWTPSATLSSDNTTSVNASPVTTTTYTVDGESNGCLGSTTVTVTVGPPVTPTFNGSGPFCAGTAVTPISSTSLEGITGSWSPAINNLATTTYTFTPSAGQCATQTTASITITQPTASQFNPLPPICIDGIQPSLPAQDINGITGSWSPSTISNQASGTYTFTPDASQCALQGTINAIVMPNPVASFSASDMELETTSTSVSFHNSSSNASTFDWTFGDGNTSSAEDPSHTFPGEPGGYTITLTATNDLGCSDQTSITISIKEDIYVFVPNSFTPDGDEYNNEFRPVISGDFDPHNFTMYIFDRWGELIYETHDINIGWDGTYHDQLVKDGVYTWKLDVKLKTLDDRRTYVGSLTMIR